MHGHRSAALHSAFQSASHSVLRMSCRVCPTNLLRSVVHCFLACLLGLSAVGVLQAAEPADLGELFRTGKYEECVAAATAAIKASEFNETYRLWKLRAELELGRYTDAVATLDAGLKTFPGCIQLRWWGREAFRYTNQLPRVAELNEQIGQFVRSNPGYYSDAANRIILGRFLLSEGLDPKRILDGAYNIIKRQLPNYVPAYLASGELALDKQDYALAAESFEKAAKLDPREPDAHFGLALAFAPSDSAQADAALKAVMALNPHHLGALLLSVDELIDAERYDAADSVLKHLAEINPHHPRAAAYRAILAHLRNQPDREKTHRDAGLKFWSTNPEVDHVIGKKLSQKYRFAEGAEHQRAAILLDPKYLPAKF